MKTILSTLALVSALSLNAVAIADTPNKDTKSTAPACACDAPDGKMMMHSSGGMMGHGMGMGMDMMGMGHHSMCPIHAASKVEITKTAKGVTITLTGDDAKTIARIQKLAEIMRLERELDDQN